MLDLEPLPAVVDVESAMEPGAPLARLVDEEETGGDLESIHAGGVGKGAEDGDQEPLSGNVLDTVHRSHRLLGAARLVPRQRDDAIVGARRAVHTELTGFSGLTAGERRIRGCRGGLDLARSPRTAP